MKNVVKTLASILLLVTVLFLIVPVQDALVEYFISAGLEDTKIMTNELTNQIINDNNRYNDSTTRAVEFMTDFDKVNKGDLK